MRSELMSVIDKEVSDKGAICKKVSECERKEITFSTGSLGNFTW